MSKRLLLIVSMALMFVLGACGGFSDNEKTEGSGKTEKVLNLSMDNDIPNLNSVLSEDGISFNILNNFMEGLYRVDENNEPRPAMAESVDISDDKLTYTFHLRDGIKWSNGEPVTAENFKFSWLRALHPDTSGPYTSILADYIVGGEEHLDGEVDESEVGINVIDDQTLEVSLLKPTPYFLGLTAFPTYFPLNEDFVNEVGEDKFGLKADTILYNGPFEMTEYDQADGVTLVRNEEYWDKDNVELDKVSMKVIKEKSTALNLYEAGDLDRVTLSSNDVDNFKDDEEFGTRTEFSVQYLQFNFLEEPFDNKNIRKAFQLAFDPNILTETVLNNGSEPAHGLVAIGVHGDEENTFRDIAGDIVEPDFDAAKEYLEKGLEEIGELPPIELLTADDTVAKDAATFLQSAFQENLGVDIDLSTKPFSGRIDAMRENNFQMAIAGWGSDYNDAIDILDLWYGDPPTGLRGSFSHPDVQNMIDGAFDETDEIKRLDMLIEAERIVIEDEASVGPLYFKGSAFLQKNYVKDLVIHPYGASLELKDVKIDK